MEIHEISNETFVFPLILMRFKTCTCVAFTQCALRHPPWRLSTTHCTAALTMLWIRNEYFASLIGIIPSSSYWFHQLRTETHVKHAHAQNSERQQLQSAVQQCVQICTVKMIKWYYCLRNTIIFKRKKLWIELRMKCRERYVLNEKKCIHSNVKV